MQPNMQFMARLRVSKWDIRNKIWDYMEANNLADFPRPVHHRIPNFKGSFQTGVSIKSWDGFGQAREVKVDPDKPLEGIRLSVLQVNKFSLLDKTRPESSLVSSQRHPSNPGVFKLDSFKTCGLQLPDFLLQSC
uniref:Methenyltetrahydrofolate synthetase domain containing n=1 Tax=Pseudonaja textilis TaxID=8673 RepID=A0A670YQY6_PSETE